MATRQQFSDFLSDVEIRAYKQALYAVRDEQAALDIVQDSMLKLTEKYSDKPAEQLPLLFQRILQNTITDHYRRQKIRSTWVTLFSAFSSESEEKDNEYSDLLETLQVNDDSIHENNPAVQLEREQLVNLIEKAIETLSARQREAFLLRYWEEMSLAETAEIMNCSQGSVKTHCSRAVHALAAKLKEKGVKL